MRNGIMVRLLLAVLAFVLIERPAQAAVDVCEPLTSRLTPGGFYIGQANSNTEVHFDGRQVRVADNGQFIIGFGRDAELKQRFKLVHESGQKELIDLDLEPRSYDIQRIEGVAGKYVNPAAELIQRIRDEALQVTESRQFETVNLDFFSGMTQPAQGRITGVYGSQRIFNGEPRRPHYGLDFAGPVGQPVIASADGVVRLADADLYYSGGTIVIDHGFGLSSSYLHLSSVDVSVGDDIKRGQPIGKVGATGRVTGPHLDWRINWFDVRLDPALFLVNDPSLPQCDTNT